MFRILIVEDNLAFRLSLKDILQTRFPSMEIIEAGDGKEAFEKIDTLPPDLIFMDIRLPGENGLVLTKRIKADHPDIPIIVLTSYDLPEYRKVAYECKANHFMTKSTATSEILTVVESIISESGKKL